MFLPEGVLWGLGPIDTQSEITITCKLDDSEAVKKAFIELFDKKWTAALDSVEKEYGSCREKENHYNPINSITAEENKIIVNLSAPAIYSGDEECFSAYTGDDALKETLEQIKVQYADVTIEGYVGYTWSDMHSGEVVQYEFPEADPDKIYASVGKAVQAMLEEDEDYFIEKVLENDDESEVEAIVKWVKAYEGWLPEDFGEKLIAYAEEEAEEMAEALKRGLW